MSDKPNDGGPAYPQIDSEEASECALVYTPNDMRGLSRRDYFAGQALAGLCAEGGYETAGKASCLGAAREAVAFADALLKELDG